MKKKKIDIENEDDDISISPSISLSHSEDDEYYEREDITYMRYRLILIKLIDDIYSFYLILPLFLLFILFLPLMLVSRIIKKILYIYE